MADVIPFPICGEFMEPRLLYMHGCELEDFDE